MKKANVTITAPELPAAHAQFSGTGKGSRVPVAIFRAIENAFARHQAAKGKRITKLSMTVTISNFEKDKSNG